MTTATQSQTGSQGQDPSAACQSTANGGFLATNIDALIGWGRSHSLWPYPYATACCGIEFMSAACSRFDLARYASEFFRFTPRSADLLLVMGTVNYKQAPILRRVWEQMSDPKWVIAVGACACSGGMYDCYCTVPGIDEIIPVDVYIGGCPPRPEGFFEALMMLQEKIKDESYMEQRRQGLHQKVYIG